MAYTKYIELFKLQIASALDGTETARLQAELWLVIQTHYRLTALETFCDIRDSLANARNY
jgi:hypothetical protein